MNGVVISNISSTGESLPYLVNNTYTEAGLDYATLQDDYGRTFAGNPLEAQNELFTQCYNDTLVRPCTGMRMNMDDTGGPERAVHPVLQ